MNALTSTATTPRHQDRSDREDHRTGEIQQKNGKTAEVLRPAAYRLAQVLRSFMSVRSFRAVTGERTAHGALT